MEKINGDTEVYTFEYIVDQINYPKAYGRKFVVLEKYKEINSDLNVLLDYIFKGAASVDEEMVNEIAEKYGREIEDDIPTNR
jgi:hypothetical protein